MKFIAVLVILSATTLLGNALRLCPTLLECRQNYQQQQVYCGNLYPPSTPPAHETDCAAALRKFSEDLTPIYKQQYSFWNDCLKDRIDDAVELSFAAEHFCTKHEEHPLAVPVEFQLPAALDSFQLPAGLNKTAQAAAQAIRQQMQLEYTDKVRDVRQWCSLKQLEIGMECNNLVECCSESPLCSYNLWLSPVWAGNVPEERDYWLKQRECTLLAAGRK